MKDLPLVSIVSVNYNQKEHTVEFLNSLYDSEYQNFEVIVVDNGSKDPLEKKSLEIKFTNLKCIILEKNLGFAGGNNIGIKKAKGQFLIFLNNDTIIPKSFISDIIHFLSDKPNVGIISPKVIYPNGLIQYAGSNGINFLTMRGSRIGLMERDSGQYDSIYETSLPHGAAMAVRKEAIDKVGLMPEAYFLYYEEHEWCTNFLKMGFKTVYLGTTQIIHKESVSIGSHSPMKVYYLSRNRLLFLLRNGSVGQILSGTLFSIFISLPTNTLRYLIKGEFPQLISLWNGYLWHLGRKR